MREIILDTETTGLEPRAGDRIIEIACIELHERMWPGKKFQRYINPERDIPASATAVHGITSEHLRGKPRFADIADEFLAFIGADPLVIHNAPFDLAFLNEELRRCGRPVLPRERTVDTLEMARRKFPGAGNSLDRLAERFRIDTSARTVHGGLVDAGILLEVYLDLTGSRRLDLGMDALLVESGAEESGPVRPRPVPLAPRSTPEERAAHERMVREGLGKKALWLQLGAMIPSPSASD